jgi:hypothetical protein
MRLFAATRLFRPLVSALRPKNLRLALFILVFLFAGIGYAQTAIPDTPAGKTLRAWLAPYVAWNCHIADVVS